MSEKISLDSSGQTDEIQGVSFSKGEYTFKGSEIDRSFSYSKLDKYFGDAGLTTAGSNKQTITAQTQEPAINKSDNSLLAGLGGLFSVSTACRLSANWVWNIFAAKIGDL